ncbi:hypothetical protein U1Q18_043691 [Sarracenia purpurea var. burkii]
MKDCKRYNSERLFFSQQFKSVTLEIGSGLLSLFRIPFASSSCRKRRRATDTYCGNRDADGATRRTELSAHCLWMYEYEISACVFVSLCSAFATCVAFCAVYDSLDYRIVEDCFAGSFLDSASALFPKLYQSGGERRKKQGMTFNLDEMKSQDFL